MDARWLNMNDPGSNPTVILQANVDWFSEMCQKLSIEVVKCVESCLGQNLEVKPGKTISLQKKSYNDCCNNSVLICSFNLTSSVL